MEILENEIWVDYPNYEGLYLISNFGRVASYYRSKTLISKTSTKIIKSCIGNGYFHNTLCIGGKRKTNVVHKAVAKCFVNNPKPNEYNIINHKDGNKLNNHYTNLEWCSSSMNTRHAFDKGLMVAKRGEECSFSKFSEFTVSRIKVFIRLKMKLRAISKIFGCHESHISMIKNGRAWKHVA